MRKRNGIFRGVTAKVLIVGTTLLVGLSMAAAAVALPGSNNHMASATVDAVSRAQLPSATGASATSASATVHAGLHTAGGHGGVAAAGGVSTTTAGTAAANAGANANVGGSGAGITGAVSLSGNLGTGGASGGHAGSGAGTTVSGIAASLTGCLNSVLNTVTGKPIIAIGSLIPTVVACVKNVLASLPLPTIVTSCVSSLFNLLGGLTRIGSGNGTINLTGCVPVNVGSCLQAGLGSAPGLLRGPTGITSAPAAIEACATSIVNAVRSVVKSMLGQVTGAMGGNASIHGSVSVRATTR
jgi:hypothetical protein